MATQLTQHDQNEAEWTDATTEADVLVQAMSKNEANATETKNKTDAVNKVDATDANDAEAKKEEATNDPRNDENLYLVNLAPYTGVSCLLVPTNVVSVVRLGSSVKISYIYPWEAPLILSAPGHEDNVVKIVQDFLAGDRTRARRLSKKALQAYHTYVENRAKTTQATSVPKAAPQNAYADDVRAMVILA